jgi:hypothetical protein
MIAMAVLSGGGLLVIGTGEEEAMDDRGCSSWDDWDAKAYLRDYYARVEPDEEATIAFLVRTFAAGARGAATLEIGCGPTLHHVFPATPYASEIHMADYLAENLKEIECWIEGRDERHQWSEFVRYTLKCEGIAAPTCEDAAVREELTRRRITRLLHAEVSQDDPLGTEYRQAYPIVLSCYCADSVTSDKLVWTTFMRNIGSLVAPGGVCITAALRRAAHYQVGAKRFPSANIDEADMRSALEEGAGLRIVALQTASVPEHRAQGYEGIILAAAENRRT